MSACTCWRGPADIAPPCKCKPENNTMPSFEKIDGVTYVAQTERDILLAENARLNAETTALLDSLLDCVNQACLSNGESIAQYTMPDIPQAACLWFSHFRKTSSDWPNNPDGETGLSLAANPSCKNKSQTGAGE